LTEDEAPPLLPGETLNEYLDRLAVDETTREVMTSMGRVVDSDPNGMIRVMLAALRSSKPTRNFVSKTVAQHLSLCVSREEVRGKPSATASNTGSAHDTAVGGESSGGGELRGQTCRTVRCEG
jgi:hypothetical protein